MNANQDVKHNLLAAFVVISLLVSCGSGVSPQDDTNDSSSRPSNLQLTSPTLSREAFRGRFLMMGDTLYALNGMSLNIFDLSNRLAPKKAGSISLGEQVESLAHDQQYLFVGSKERTIVYDVKDSGNPTELGSFKLPAPCATAISGKLSSFSALRTSQKGCSPGKYRISILGTLDPKVPAEAGAFELSGGEGFGITGDQLLACDRVNGLMVFNIGNPRAVKQVPFAHNELCRDIFVKDKVIVVSGESGVTQFSLEDDGVIKIIGQLKIDTQ